MKRTPIQPDLTLFPEVFHPLLHSGAVYDSSCSREARVYYIPKDGGLFLKTAPKGTLKAEADMNAFFHSRGLGAEVVHYLAEEADWLLTRQVPGEDCTAAQYLEEPRRLCDTTATLLRRLHETDPSGCPVTDRSGAVLRTVRERRSAGKFDPELFSGKWGFSSAQEAWQQIERYGGCLRSDVLLHGDYCLPNILLDNWQFSGFIDLGTGGVGDRHFDVFWGLWTLCFNLKTNAYYDRFLDVYGREAIQPELLRTVAAIEGFL